MANEHLTLAADSFTLEVSKRTSRLRRRTTGMPNQGKVPLKEHNNQSGGRSGSETLKHGGPAKSPMHNPTEGGGINRPTKSG